MPPHMFQMMALASNANGMGAQAPMAIPLPHADMRHRSEPLKEKLLLQHTDASAHHTYLSEHHQLWCTASIEDTCSICMHLVGMIPCRLAQYVHSYPMNLFHLYSMHMNCGRERGCCYHSSTVFSACNLSKDSIFLHCIGVACHVKHHAQSSLVLSCLVLVLSSECSVGGQVC